jgi:hypothetical protein
MLTIAPRPAAIIGGRAYLAINIIEVTLTRIARSQASGSASTASPAGPVTPTLLTRMSSPPKASSVRSTARQHDSAPATFASTTIASPPSWSTIRPVSSAQSRRSSISATRAPSRAKTIAVARPLPTIGPSGPAGREPAPVMIATLPASLRACGNPGSPAGGWAPGSRGLTATAPRSPSSWKFASPAGRGVYSPRHPGARQTGRRRATPSRASRRARRDPEGAY